MKTDAPRGKIYDSIVDTIGATPLVRAHRITKDCRSKVDILLKLEFFNPLASVKDRIAAAMIEAMEEAASLQEDMPYMEPPWWYYPAKQTLAAYLLQDGQTDRAEQLFLETLTESPNNAWVLYGLSETYKAQGDKNAAKYAGALFKEAWAGDKKSYPSLAAL